MSSIPKEYLSEFDFGFNVVDDIPQSQIQIETQPTVDDVEGINDNVLRIEQKVDAVVTAVNSLSAKMMNLDDEFDVIKTTTESEVKSKLTDVEKLIMPLLVNLLKTADKEYIYWPDRSTKINDIIEQLLSHTRPS